jgi:putative membrane protein
MFTRSVVLRTAVLFPLLSAGMALADPADGRYFDHYGMMGGAGWFYGPIMMLLFFGLLVAAVVLIVRLLGGAPLGQGWSRTEDRSQAILRERFAKGEITQEEFEKAKKALD